MTGCTKCLDLCPASAIAPAGDHVAIDRPGRAGEVGQGEGREEHEQKGEAEHGGERSRAGMARMRWGPAAGCRLLPGSHPVYPQDSR